MTAFGTLGAWVPRLSLDVLVPLARELEEDGYGTMWLGGGVSPGLFETVHAILDGTRRITVATGIANIWVETPRTVTEAWHHAETAHPGRLHIGLGVSHAVAVDRMPGRTYAKPLSAMRRFLDELDAFGDPLPPERRVLGALGPKMLTLSAERTAGTHPYLVTTENTAAARAAVPSGVVAPELGVVLDADRSRGRATGREALRPYLGLPNYTNNWLRSGLREEDFVGGGSDALIDALLAVGDVDVIHERIAAHRAAGADHVAVQVIASPPELGGAYRRIAGSAAQRA